MSNLNKFFVHNPAEAYRLFLPYAFAKRNGIYVKLDKGDPIPRAISRTDIDPEVLQEVKRFIEMPFELIEAANDRFDEMLAAAYQRTSEDTDKELENMGSIDLGSIADAIPETEDLLEQQENAPVIKLINALLIKAIEERASDIHIETFEKHMSIRFRIDGILQEVIKPKRSIAPMLVSRIKVMSHLNIAEKRLPQDGHISLKLAGREIDVRVSTIPTSGGERVVLRLLDKSLGKISLEDLGMSPDDLKTMRHIISKPHGVVLVTGPTGMGKTSTLYAALISLNDGRHNIMTVEDPIEYVIGGIGQTQVNKKINMDFAQGLRAILRQDPDIVMIGEIRDEETARTAIQASLTGHMVFSTLHTNSAIGAVARLRDMEIESYLLSSGLIGLIAQRLVRKLCNNCKEAYIADKNTYEFLEVDSSPQLYRAKGCSECRGSGYKGRRGVFEVVSVDDEMQQLIHDGASEKELEICARKQSVGMFNESCRKVLSGETSVEEIRRVVLEE